MATIQIVVGPRKPEPTGFPPKSDENLDRHALFLAQQATELGPRFLVAAYRDNRSTVPAGGGSCLLEGKKRPPRLVVSPSIYQMSWPGECGNSSKPVSSPFLGFLDQFRVRYASGDNLVSIRCERLDNPSKVGVL